MNIDPETGVNLFSAVLLVGAAQGLFLTVATFFGGKRPGRANACLAGLMFAFVLELTFRFVIATGYIRLLPGILAIHWALDLVYGPLIYLYTRELTDTGGAAGPGRTLFHFALPAGGMFLGIVLWFNFSATAFLGTLDDSCTSALGVGQAVLALAGIASMVGYLWACFRLLHRHRSNVTSNFSYLERKSLDWLRNLLIVLAVLLFLYLAYAITELGSPVLADLYPLAIVIAVFTIGFMGIKQPIVFDRRLADRQEFVLPKQAADTNGRTSAAKYSKSALSEADARAIYREIEAIMQAEHLYQLNDLSLPMLAGRLELPSHYVSQAINQGSGSNFFDFVNRKRVMYVTGRLAKPDSTGTWNVLDLAMEAGFNSKTAFYKAFRAFTGQTPKQYQKSVSTST